MTRTWQPGDVAWWEEGGGPGEILFRYIDYVHDNEPSWHTVDSGDGYPDESTLRPLVVIDPENREQVERFCEIASRWADQVPYADMAEPGDMDHVDAMQAALREFANPQPPKPTEPCDPAARVIDKNGDAWATHEGRWQCLGVNRFPLTWDDLVCNFGPLEIRP